MSGDYDVMDVMEYAQVFQETKANEIEWKILGTTQQRVVRATRFYNSIHFILYIDFLNRNVLSSCDFLFVIRESLRITNRRHLAQW